MQVGSFIPGIEERSKASDPTAARSAEAVERVIGIWAKVRVYHPVGEAVGTSWWGKTDHCSGCWAFEAFRLHQRSSQRRISSGAPCEHGKKCQWDNAMMDSHASIVRSSKKEMQHLSVRNFSSFLGMMEPVTLLRATLETSLP